MEKQLGFPLARDHRVPGPVTCGTPKRTRPICADCFPRSSPCPWRKAYAPPWTGSSTHHDLRGPSGAHRPQDREVGSERDGRRVGSRRMDLRGRLGRLAPSRSQCPRPLGILGAAPFATLLLPPSHRRPGRASPLTGWIRPGRIGGDRRGSVESDCLSRRTADCRRADRVGVEAVGGPSVPRGALLPFGKRSCGRCGVHLLGLGGASLAPVGGDRDRSGAGLLDVGGCHCRSVALSKRRPGRSEFRSRRRSAVRRPPSPAGTPPGRGNRSGASEALASDSRPGNEGLPPIVTRTICKESHGG